MIYPIVAYGDAVLREKAKDIPNDGTVDLKALCENMFETMYHAEGVGLAAPQIGMAIRLFVVDTGADEEEGESPFKKVFVNPQILEERGEPWGFEEGCLSIPEIRGQVMRKPIVKIRYFDENWVEHTDEFDGMPARVIQHEYDHIEGVLFTDHLSPIRRRLLKGKLEGISKGEVRTIYRMRFPNVKSRR
jgi:peptide deformylase